MIHVLRCYIVYQQLCMYYVYDIVENRFIKYIMKKKDLIICEQLFVRI